MQKKHLTKSDVEKYVKDCAETIEGKVLLFWLMSECGFDRNIMHDDPNITQAYAAKRGVYAKLRKMIEVQDLIEIEHKFDFKMEVTKGKTK